MTNDSITNRFNQWPLIRVVSISWSKVVVEGGKRSRQLQDPLEKIPKNVNECINLDIDMDLRENPNKC